MPILAKWSPYLLSLLRFVAGLAFIQHGLSKYFGIPPFPMPMNPLFYTAGAIELVAGALLILGLLTRPAAFLASGMSAVGYFMIHAPLGFFPAVNGGETILLYAFIFLFIASAGAGPISLDAMRQRSNG